ncbi:MAG: asparagine synthase [Peptococcaceae bacterium]
MQKNKKSNLAFTGVGAAVTGVGALVGGSLGAGIMGFGLAHVVLGGIASLEARNSR